MSVFEREGSPFFWYKFEFKGRRFSRSTETTNRREAERVEQAAREAAILEVAAEREGAPKPGAPMTLNIAAQKYWLNHASTLRAAKQIDKNLTWLVKTLGPDTAVRDIGNPQVADMVGKRRGQLVVNAAVLKGRKKDAKGRKRRERQPIKHVSAATVNRSAVDPLRSLLLYCRDVLEEPVRPIKWALHRRAEPDERIRIMKPGEEEAAIMSALPAKYHPLVTVKKRIGLRIFEMIKLEWADIDWENLSVSIEGKGGRRDTVPLPTDVRDILWALPRRSPRVFAHEDGSPMTYSGVNSAWRRACRKAGVKGLRLHDLRHTAGTDILRRTGNLRVAMKLLRHRDIRSTMRYAHVADDDVRAGLELGVTQNATMDRYTEDKALKV